MKTGLRIVWAIFTKILKHSLRCCTVNSLYHVYPQIGHTFEKEKWDWGLYSQLLPCEHLAITDTPLIRTAPINSRYYGLATTDLRTLYSVPTSQFYCFLSCCQRVRPSGRPEGLTRRKIIEPRKDMCMEKKSHKCSKYRVM